MKIILDLSYKAWLLTRPKSVRKLAKEFHHWLGKEIHLNGTPHWIVGFGENDTLVLTILNPSQCESDEYKHHVFMRELPANIIRNK